MNNTAHTRKEKIEILKGLQTGQIRIKEIVPNGPWILEDAVALNAGSGKTITREQFEKRQAAGRIKGAVIDWLEESNILNHE